MTALFWRGLMLVGCLSTTALADDLPPIGPHTLGIFPPGQEVCFKQVYDQAHLRKHPRQLLTEFYLYRLMQPDPTREYVELSRADAVNLDKHAESSTQWLSVLARFKDNPGFYRQTVECRDDADGGISCGRDCDGGGFGLARKDRDLMLHFDDRHGGGLALESACEPEDEDHDRWLDPKDDQEFVRVAPRPVAECTSPDREAHPAYAQDPVPLRERGFRCLKRVYDARHLQQHPKQKVAALAVSIAGPARTTQDSDGYTMTKLDISLALHLTDGKRQRRQLTCIADDFEFNCDQQFRLRRRDGKSVMLLVGDDGSTADATDPQLLGLKLGKDDRIFRLDARQEQACEPN